MSEGKEVRKFARKRQVQKGEKKKIARKRHIPPSRQSAVVKIGNEIFENDQKKEKKLQRKSSKKRKSYKLGPPAEKVKVKEKKAKEVKELDEHLTSGNTDSKEDNEIDKFLVLHRQELRKPKVAGFHRFGPSFNQIHDIQMGVKIPYLRTAQALSQFDGYTPPGYPQSINILDAGDMRPNMNDRSRPRVDLHRVGEHKKRQMGLHRGVPPHKKPKRRKKDQDLPTYGGPYL